MTRSQGGLSVSLSTSGDKRIPLWTRCLCSAPPIWMRGALTHSLAPFAARWPENGVTRKAEKSPPSTPKRWIMSRLHPARPALMYRLNNSSRANKFARKELSALHAFYGIFMNLHCWPAPPSPFCCVGAAPAASTPRTRPLPRLTSVYAPPAPGVNRHNWLLPPLSEY